MAIEHRNLGSTGVRVSPLCLGAMMFGAWGNTDHGDSIAIVHRALDDDVLDRIDEIVAPALNVKADERGWDPPWLADASLRRRSPARERS